MKTNRDVLHAMFDQLVGPALAKEMAADFDRQFGVHVNQQELNQVVSDEEFQDALLKIKEEAPAFAAWLLRGSEATRGGGNN